MTFCLTDCEIREIQSWTANYFKDFVRITVIFPSFFIRYFFSWIGNVFNFMNSYFSMNDAFSNSKNIQYTVYRQVNGNNLFGFIQSITLVSSFLFTKYKRKFTKMNYCAINELKSSSICFQLWWFCVIQFFFFEIK